MRVTVYTKPGCHLCEDVLVILDRLTPHYGLQVQEVNILDDMALYDAYHLKIPVVTIEDGRLGTLEAPIDEPTLRAAFDIARRALPTGPSAGRPSSIVHRPRPEPLLDRLAHYIGGHWVPLASSAMAIFVGLPWLAGVFAWLGWWDAANPIYTAYALTCHQLPERAGSVFGYQVAFCYRNTALYGGTALFGLTYGLARGGRTGWLSWIKKPLPWWGLVLFLLPIAIDGFTHMLGLREPMDDMSMPAFGSFWVGSQPFSFNWWLRILTGLLAALGAVWFAYPRMGHVVEESEALREAYRLGESGPEGPLSGSSPRG